MEPAEDFRSFVVARQRALLRTAWLLTGDWGAAEDLVQTALLRAWPHWARVARDGGTEAYVRRVMVNAALSWRRRRWHGEVPTAVLPDLAGHEDDATVTHVLVAAVRQLPARQRAVIVLRYLDDLSEADTAAALGCSVGTVKSQASKALASLRRHPDLSDSTLLETAP